jgi:hypothetical protein
MIEKLKPYAPLNLHQDKLERAVIFCDSKAALLSAGSTETVISAEARYCQVLIRQGQTQIALQWIPGRCQIVGNEYADALVKKGAKIIQTRTRETSYHSVKLHLAEAVGFFGRKNPQHAFLRRGSKAVCPMSQLCGMLKNHTVTRESHC